LSVSYKRNNNSKIIRDLTYIQGVPGVKVTTSEFNSRADSESKNNIHTGPIRNGSGIMSF